MLKKLFAIFGLLILVALFLNRVRVKETALYFTKPTLPAPKSAHEFSKNPETVEKTRVAPQKQNPAPQPVEPGTSSAPKSVVRRSETSAVSKIEPPVVSQTELPAVSRIELPESMNLNIPFAPQAPFADWGLPYQEACEEAAIIMAHRFFTGQQLDLKIMDEEILKLVDWEKETFGYYEHTNAAEIAQIMRDYFGHANVEVKYEFTALDIKREIANGHPVILPAAGRLLQNQYFRQPGPLYHALVIKGYTKNKFITNDPGTRRGADFLYDQEFLMSTLHEWHPDDILQGRPAMIVVRR